ncbi:MAG TPA: patatin-like phospholipase family protein [Burkholderiaceae bacterium]|nr:patatin-like phospholipase family protein [Burkholderiaceae bacterium]
MTRTRQEHLDRDKVPKRILALDGGGIRGILTLGYLGEIEDLLRKRSGNPKLLLCDYFDLIGGTSTGSIIAAALACGVAVADLKELYRQLGNSVFEAKFYRKGFLVPKFPAEPVRQALEKNLGKDTTLDSDRIRTGLMIMAKRLDTGSPWPLHNHPDARYAKQDGQLLLTQVVRASTAAPTYFEPEVISISSRDGSETKGAFVDGGVSPFNDPALQLLMLAALHGHGFRWQTGKDKLLLVSVGTGTYKETFDAEALLGMTPVEQGLRALQSLMDDCARVNQGMLQWLTRCLTPWTIDRAVGDMQQDSVAGPQLATYARYNALLDSAWLKSNVGIERRPDEVAMIAAMDNPKNMDELAEIGRLAANRQVQTGHFPPEFDT